MAHLSELMSGPQRTAVISDCGELVEGVVAKQSGITGMALKGGTDPKLVQPFADRAATIGVTLDYQSFPVTFWDVFGEKGHPVRSTPAEMGPLLLSRLARTADFDGGH